ncbi:uncharacterized protein DEA37_0003850 [Paragonimus westermani]|uniref:Uncharacterized protein n=1 Tax=Paragonimus westermani TaxID=34504 RepID=A0A5J4NVW4_9TREM|nr:uncharacterized protein DEA37_0003850 [Paragonimus westermani]
MDMERFSTQRQLLTMFVNLTPITLCRFLWI